MQFYVMTMQDTCKTVHTCARGKMPQNIVNNVMVSGQQYGHRQETIDTIVLLPDGKIKYYVSK